MIAYAIKNNGVLLINTSWKTEADVWKYTQYSDLDIAAYKAAGYEVVPVEVTEKEPT